MCDEPLPLAAAPRELTHDRPPPPPTPQGPPKRVGAWSAVVEHAVLPPTCGCNHPYSGEAMPHLQPGGVSCFIGEQKLDLGCKVR
eukprot:scaffold6307_cov111-Isochrysis_galbana.AAC.3